MVISVSVICLEPANSTAIAKEEIAAGCATVATCYGHHVQRGSVCIGFGTPRGNPTTDRREWATEGESLAVPGQSTSEGTRFGHVLKEVCPLLTTTAGHSLVHLFTSYICNIVHITYNSRLLFFIILYILVLRALLFRISSMETFSDPDLEPGWLYTFYSIIMIISVSFLLIQKEPCTYSATLLFLYFVRSVQFHWVQFSCSMSFVQVQFVAKCDYDYY